MSSRLFIPVFLIFVFLFFGTTKETRSEIIQISKLKAEKKDYSITRDIFSPIKMPQTKAGQPIIEEDLFPGKPPEEEKKDEKPVEEPQPRYTISFEGYLIKSTGSHALLKVNGEEFIAGEKDLVYQDKIQIVKVDRHELTVEIDSNTIKIKLTGDDEENVQTNHQRL